MIALPRTSGRQATLQFGDNTGSEPTFRGHSASVMLEHMTRLHARLAGGGESAVVGAGGDPTIPERDICATATGCGVDRSAASGTNFEADWSPESTRARASAPRWCGHDAPLLEAHATEREDAT
jgi:hypothetical protein